MIDDFTPEQKAEWLENFKLDNDPRITRTGQFLRKSSLDELPQLINVFKGELSIVGPRPALWNQYELVAEREKYGAKDIKPGITGWVQINSREELEISVKAQCSMQESLKVLRWI